MRAPLRVGIIGCGCVAVIAAILRFSGASLAMADEKTAPAGKPLAHMVYFTLAESTPANRDQLVANCKKYLDQHEGVVYFSVGTLSDYKREVNDREYDVALHLVFKDNAAHDVYQDHPRHQEFITNSKNLWKKVRVFDSVLQ
ncbi:MAG: Dabb family protein [Pirellulales bacterium]|nr:Dabb family protein [Pirellulales bacterium]